jgi:hypothetical protein
VKICSVTITLYLKEEKFCHSLNNFHPIRGGGGRKIGTGNINKILLSDCTLFQNWSVKTHALFMGL